MIISALTSGKAVSVASHDRETSALETEERTVEGRALVVLGDGEDGLGNQRFQLALGDLNAVFAHEFRHRGEFLAGGSGDLELRIAAGDRDAAALVDVEGDLAVRERAHDLQNLRGVQHIEAFLVDRAFHRRAEPLFEVEGGDAADVLVLAVVFAEFRIRRALEEEAFDCGEGVFGGRDPGSRDDGAEKVLFIKGYFHGEPPDVGSGLWGYHGREIGDGGIF